MKLLEREPIPITFWRVPQETSKNGHHANDDGQMDSEDGLMVSEETYWREYYDHPDFNYEWVNGRLEEKPVSNLETAIMYGWLLKILDIFLEVHKIADLIRLEAGFVVPLSPSKEAERVEEIKKKRLEKLKKKGRQEDFDSEDIKVRKHIRKPDLGVVLKSNPTPYNKGDNNYDGVADLCIEAISYTTKKAKERDTKEKKEEYEHAKVKEYYILDDRKTETRFYRLNSQGVYSKIEPIDGDVIKSEVLPGFQFRISDLYRQPDREELVKDEVYQGFVMVKYQAEKLRADLSDEKARAEKERADLSDEMARAEKERADRLQAENERLQAEKERADRLQEEKDRVQADKDRLMALLEQMGIEIS